VIGLSASEVWIFLFTYLLPILFFVYTGIDVMLRNSKKTEHRLLCVTAAVYALMFIEEYIRHQLPISSSPALSALWFSNIGIIMPGLGFHFLAKFSGMDKRMPRYLYPAIFYLPLLVIPINILSSKEIISSSVFIQEGIWKYPVYNAAYYIALTVSIAVSSLYLVVLYKGKAYATTREHKAIFYLLIFAVILCTIWHIMFGYAQFEHLPPYPYIYGGVIWCFILRLAMLRFEFLDFATKRYEKLFNLNPAAILLVDLAGHIKEANPSARQLFSQLNLDKTSLYTFVDEQLRHCIEGATKINEYETSIYNGGKRLDVLIDGDTIAVDNERHMILIVRDITVQKENQDEIRFLAYHDPLTRLPNRRFFYEKLREAIERAESSSESLAVIVMDMDLFKEINDKYGHEAGDELLRHVAPMISELAGSSGVAARLGGDEFVLFLKDIPSITIVEEMLTQLKQRLDEVPLQYRDHVIPVRISMGASFFPDDGVEADTLLMIADRAMYRAKRSNKHEYDL
jgi:diguanylate cyclase (GGDEF)-like protein/PAS domain S-box-containing protein